MNKEDISIVIRKLQPTEVCKLEDMLYEAVFQPDEENLIPRSVIKMPKIEAYIKDFGKEKDDHCIVADHNGEIVGAVWVRTFPGELKAYGYIDDCTPVFAMSLLKKYRSQGIGSLLMKEMLSHLRKNGYKQASLSVQKMNYAVKLYKKMNFRIVEEDAEDYLMLVDL